MTIKKATAGTLEGTPHPGTRGGRIATAGDIETANNQRETEALRLAKQYVARTPIRPIAHSTEVLIRDLCSDDELRSAVEGAIAAKKEADEGDYIDSLHVLRVYASPEKLIDLLARNAAMIDVLSRFDPRHLSLALAKSAISSCTCLTKTPDFLVHKAGCRYGAIKSVAAAVEAGMKPELPADEIDWREVPLKLCPRCNCGARRHEYDRADSSNMVRIQCGHCGLAGKDHFYSSMELAVTEWNDLPR